MTRVKICGIQNEAHALAAVEEGADFIGLVFAPSPRQVTIPQARKITAAIKGCRRATQVVGVFVNWPAPVVNRNAEDCNLDWIQLSGDENWEYCQRLEKPIIKAVRIKRGQKPREIYEGLASEEKLLGTRKHLYLIDSHAEGKYGGTGRAFDWSLAGEAAKRFPVIIAGGLSPKNVARVIEKLAPWGVDVSSGVEVNRVKDIASIRAFFNAVRRADEKR